MQDLLPAHGYSLEGNTQENMTDVHDQHNAPVRREIWLRLRPQTNAYLKNHTHTVEVLLEIRVSNLTT